MTLFTKVNLILFFVFSSSLSQGMTDTKQKEQESVCEQLLTELSLTSSMRIHVVGGSAYRSLKSTVYLSGVEYAASQMKDGKVRHLFVSKKFNRTLLDDDSKTLDVVLLVRHIPGFNSNNYFSSKPTVEDERKALQRSVKRQLSKKKFGFSLGLMSVKNQGGIYYEVRMTGKGSEVLKFLTSNYGQRKVVWAGLGSSRSFLKSLFKEDTSWFENLEDEDFNVEVFHGDPGPEEEAPLGF